MTREERELLAAVHRWARTNGWTPHRLGWANAELPADATLAIRHDAGMYGLAIYHREPGGVWPTSGTYWPVDSVRQAVDVLCALGVLPAWLSSQWHAGLTAGHLEAVGVVVPFDRAAVPA